MKSNSGFVYLSLLLLWLAAGCATPVSAQDEQEFAEAALFEFFQGHIPENPYTPQGEVKWEQSGLISRGLTKAIQEWNNDSEIFNADPFMCAQANPPKWKINGVIVEGDRGQGTLEMGDGKTVYPVQIFLIKEDGKWVIDSTECFPVKP